MRRYHIQDSATYTKYNRLCGAVRQLAHRLALLAPTDTFRHKHETLLLEKLYAMGVLAQKSKMSDVESKVSVAAFCRRRLPAVMARLRMAQTLPAAVRFIEQGHVRIGPNVITDPAYLVTRNMEDCVTWVDSSKIKLNIMKYRDEVSASARKRGMLNGLLICVCQVDDFDILA